MFGIGAAEMIILALIGGMICLPLVITIVVIVILSTKQNRPRE